MSVQLKNAVIVGAVLMLASLFSKSAEGPFRGNLQRPEKDAQPANEDTPDKQLLELVNQARAEAHVPPLEWDVGLSRALAILRDLRASSACCLVRKASYSSPFGAIRWTFNPPFSPSPTGMYVSTDLASPLLQIFIHEVRDCTVI